MLTAATVWWSMPKDSKAPLQLMQGQLPPAVQRPRCIGPPAVYSKPLSFLPPRPLVIPNRAQPTEEPAARQQRHNSRGDRRPRLSSGPGVSDRQPSTPNPCHSSLPDPLSFRTGRSPVRNLLFASSATTHVGTTITKACSQERRFSAA